jgi:serine-type D-Ala-D-Ala carboxypeptidase/endopeptidase
MSKISIKIIIAIILFSLNANFVFAQEIQTFIEKEVANKRTKGIVIGIIDANGRQIFSAGKLSDKDPRKPDGNTVFEIASVTKVFTTLLLAQSSLKNQVNLNDPISKFLPKDVKTPTRNGKEISLLNLSTHTSGFPRFPYNYDQRTSNNPYTIKQMYEYISNFKSEVDFGAEFKYSNTGMALLGNISSIIARKDYEKLVNEEICKPLKMKRTDFLITSELKKNMAVGHSPYGKMVRFFNEGAAFNPTGGLRSSVNDLLNFAEANLGLTKTNLTPAIELTHVTRGSIGTELGYDADIKYDFSMGWNIWTKRDKTIYWKDGTSFGFRSFVAFDKASKKAVVILSNSFNPINDIGLHLLDSTYELKPFKYGWNLLDTINATIKKKGVDAAIKQYYQLKAAKNPQFFFDEEILDSIGNDLFAAKKIADATKIYRLNIKEYPKSTTAFESLAEMYRQIGNKQPAIENYQKLVELDPDDEHAVWMLKKLKEEK